MKNPTRRNRNGIEEKYAHNYADKFKVKMVEIGVTPFEIIIKKENSAL